MGFVWPRLTTKFYKVISYIYKKARLRISLRKHKVHSGFADGYVYPSNQT